MAIAFFGAARSIAVAALMALLAFGANTNAFAHGHHSSHGYSRSRTYHTYTPRTYHTYRTYHYHRIHRSAESRYDFERMTGYPHGRPGYVIDHIVPLACGGADTPSNMQWQTIAAGKAKDKWERKNCSRTH